VWNRTRNHDITYTYVSSVYIYMYTHMGFIINIYISPTDLWWPMIWGFNVGIYIYTVYVCIYIYMGYKAHKTIWVVFRMSELWLFWKWWSLSLQGLRFHVSKELRQNDHLATFSPNEVWTTNVNPRLVNPACPSLCKGRYHCSLNSNWCHSFAGDPTNEPTMFGGRSPSTIHKRWSMSCTRVLLFEISLESNRFLNVYYPQIGYWHAHIWIDDILVYSPCRLWVKSIPLTKWKGVASKIVVFKCLNHPEIVI
jgi:hypothetical protein